MWIRIAFLTHPQFPGGEDAAGLGTILLEPLHIKKKNPNKRAIDFFSSTKDLQKP